MNYIWNPSACRLGFQLGNYRLSTKEVGCLVLLSIFISSHKPTSLICLSFLFIVHTFIMRANLVYRSPRLNAIA